MKKTFAILLLCLTVTSQAHALFGLGGGKKYSLADIGKMVKMDGTNLSCAHIPPATVVKSLNVKRGLYIKDGRISEKDLSCSELAKEISKNGGDLNVKILETGERENLEVVEVLSGRTSVDIYSYTYRAKYNLYQDVAVQIFVGKRWIKGWIRNYIKLNAKDTLYGSYGTL